MQLTLGRCRIGLLVGSGWKLSADDEFANLRMRLVSLWTANLLGPLRPTGLAILVGEVTSCRKFLTRLLVQ